MRMRELLRGQHPICIAGAGGSGRCNHAGLDFGSNRPERHVRFAYTRSLEDLEEE